MFLTEYNEEKVLEQERAEGYEEGLAKGNASLEKALQLLLVSGKICKEDVDEIRNKLNEKYG